MAEREKMKRPTASTCAAQCRQMGIVVGDTIIGREGGGGEWWCESKLTLVWLGKQECVFTEKLRTNERPKWRSNGEVSNWTLDCRDWYKKTTATPGQSKEGPI